MTAPESFRPMLVTRYASGTTPRRKVGPEFTTLHEAEAWLDQEFSTWVTKNETKDATLSAGYVDELRGGWRTRPEFHHLHRQDGA